MQTQAEINGHQMTLGSDLVNSEFVKSLYVRVLVAPRFGSRASTFFLAWQFVFCQD